MWSAALRHFRLQCIVDAKSLYDHLVSLSSPSSVENKRCGFDLVTSRQCMQRLGATIRWAPTNRQLADAFTKDAADLADVLRSCIRNGNINCLPNIPFSTERQQSDPNAGSDRCPFNLRHCRVSRPSHQLRSWLNKGSVLNVLRQQVRSVSWSFFRPWAVSCRCAAFCKALTRSMQATRPL